MHIEPGHHVRYAPLRPAPGDRIRSGRVEQVIPVTGERGQAPEQMYRIHRDGTETAEYIAGSQLRGLTERTG